MTDAHQGEGAPPSSTDEVEVADEASAERSNVNVASLAAAGTPVGEVPVHISYGIIERFSEGLYSSPNKTFEELVTNSYDAAAGEVYVYLPKDLEAQGAALVVIDNGESMDLDGLRDLWRIGDSRKRTGEPPQGRTKPVGKFGIGKLATYVLAEELTYVVHRDDHYLAVTMDYTRVSGGHELLSGVELALQVVELTKEQAVAAVTDGLSSYTVNGSKAKMLAKIDSAAEPEHWTAAILTRLKPTAMGIDLSRLRWVLRTALPLNPSFKLWLNDDKLTSSKASGASTWNFTVGKDESDLAKNPDAPWGPGTPIELMVEDSSESDEDGDEPTETKKLKKISALRLPKAGVVWGEATLFEKPLERGKSENLARSHGFFVRVRGRLINLDDEDFSLGPELRHGTLTRFHMEVNADDLDDLVASARESLRESPGLKELKNYLLGIFNRARTASAEQDKGDKINLVGKEGRIAPPPAALSQGPLRRMLQRAAGGDTTVRAALGIPEESLATVENLLDQGENLVEKVLLERGGSESAMFYYDPERRAAVLNHGHPFVGNYIDSKQVAEPLKLLGLTELLTQAYMLDENIPAEVVGRVMKRRDNFLRALAQRHPRSAHLIAQQLRDSTNQEDALEDAVGDALQLLGFDVLRLGGPSHGTDGVGTARLGRRREPQSDSYAFTYDAKSTANALGELLRDEDGTPITMDGKPVRAQRPGKIRADTARTSILKVHRQRAAEKHDLPVVPEFTLLIAPGFQGADADEGLINDVCLNDEITAITVHDLATLVELFALQGLNPHDLRTLFEERTPTQTAAWVQKRSTEARVPKPPVATLVDLIVKYSEAKRVTSKDALGAYLATEGHDLSTEEVDALVRGLAALAPKCFYVDETVVALNATPEALYHEIRSSLDEFDVDLVRQYKETVPTTDGDST